jgi:hypothetical protein
VVQVSKKGVYDGVKKSFLSSLFLDFIAAEMKVFCIVMIQLYVTVENSI